MFLSGHIPNPDVRTGLYRTTSTNYSNAPHPQNAIKDNNHHTMDSIFTQGLEEVKRGSGFRIDFASQTLRVGKRTLIDQGCWEGTLIGPAPFMEGSQDTLLNRLRDTYRTYRHSIPSEHSDKHRSRYFKALGIEDLDMNDFVTGEKRSTAQFEIETLVLICILLGKLRWDEGQLKGWFWQDKEEPGFILLKEWFN